MLEEMSTDHIVIGTCAMAPGDIDRIYSETGVAGILSLPHDECLDYWDIDEARLLRAGKGDSTDTKSTPEAMPI